MTRSKKDLQFAKRVLTKITSYWQLKECQWLFCLLGLVSQMQCIRAQCFPPSNRKTLLELKHKHFIPHFYRSIWATSQTAECVSLLEPMRWYAISVAYSIEVKLPIGLYFSIGLMFIALKMFCGHFWQCETWCFFLSQSTLFFNWVLESHFCLPNRNYYFAIDSHYRSTSTVLKNWRQRKDNGNAVTGPSW